MAVTKFIAHAIEHPGFLRAAAKRRGLIKGDETLTASDLATLEADARKTGNTHLLRAVLLGRRLKAMH